jgi:hypothetical protein
MYGTLGLRDLLNRDTNLSVVQYGVDRMFETIGTFLAARERYMNDIMGSLVERSTDKLRRYGGFTSEVTFQKLDEFGAAAPQKTTTTPVNVGFPLDRWGIGVQWTMAYFERKTAAEFAAQFDEFARADADRLQNEMLRALMTPTNNTTYVDYMEDGVVLPIRRLTNADSTAVPTAPDGTVFNAATHTHYLARAGGALAASDVVSTVDTVGEHYAAGQLRVYIPRGLEATFRTFTSNFRAFTSPMLEIRSTTDQPVNGGRLNMLSPNDREVGLWDDKAIVSVKPWMPANYVLVWMEGSRPPLVMRTPSIGRGGGALFMEDEHRHHPLTAQFFGRYFGFGVWERTAAAVLYAGNTTYAAPTLP